MSYSYGLMTMYGLKAYIGTEYTSGTPGTWTYAQLADGIDNISEALNETVQQYFFLDGNGFAKNHVTGMAPTFTFSGRRVVGDAAQEFIFGAKYKTDSDRATSFKLEYTDASNQTVTLVCDATVCNQQEWSGATTDDSAISFELRFDGQPTIS